jgi:hypothetical protein
MQRYIDDQNLMPKEQKRVLQMIKRIQRSIANFRSNITGMQMQKEKFVYGMD